MSYLICDTEEQAQERSAAEAQTRGCDGVTAYWWGWRVHPDGRAALEVADESGLAEEEIQRLVSELPGDWFPD